MGFHELPFQLLTLIAVLLLAARVEVAAHSDTPSDLSKPHCQSTCGNHGIPSPFGIKSGCYFADKLDSFYVSCINDTTLYLGDSKYDIQISNISLDGEIEVLSSIARACFNESGLHMGDKVNVFLGHPKFRISSKSNKFTAVGCSTLAITQGDTLGHEYINTTECNNIRRIRNDSCSGTDYCQSSIPKGVTKFKATITSIIKGNPATKFDSCSYAFLVEESAYNLQERVPVVLDWAIGNENCEKAEKNRSSYACTAANSICVDSTNGPGYRCRCSPGSEGNPYTTNGCRDIDECDDQDEMINPCLEEHKICINRNGSYSCSCPEGYEEDGSKRCKKMSLKSTYLSIALGISMSFLVLALGSYLIYHLLAKRKNVKQRAKFFQQNGGFMLTEQLSKREGSAATARIFTAEDLKKATNNYHESRVIGQGGFGTVYKGILSPSNNREVAIKKSKISDQSQIEQFINEVIVLSQINHRNVVKLLGCCLETEVPMLVYEFITNGNLSEHIHNKDSCSSSLSWEMRLKIAAETAGAIAYLHSAASTPIIHRDIKSTNVLLDENYTAKVADFGASKLVPLDQTQLATLVQGTFGYIDPEYFHSNQLTEKSDVYSFGVLLAELLTGEKALSFARPEKDRCLATYFVSAVKIGHGMLDIVEKSLLEEGKIQQIKQVILLTTRCLSVKGEERPSMKEVAMELEGLKMTVQHLWVNKDSTTDQKDTQYLLKQSIPWEGHGFVGDGGSSSGYSSSAGQDSMRDQMARKVHFR